MHKLVKHSEVTAGEFRRVREAASFAERPAATPVVVPLASWLDARAALIARGNVGVRLPPADDLR